MGPLFAEFHQQDEKSLEGALSAKLSFVLELSGSFVGRFRTSSGYKLTSKRIIL
jgi:hypothetical protein